MAKPRLGDGGRPSREDADYRLNRPRTGEPWIDCHICSFSIPRGEAVLHHRFQKLVCGPCVDDLSHQDHMERRRIPDESDRVSIQPVRS